METYRERVANVRNINVRYAIQELPDDPDQLINKSIASHDMRYSGASDENHLPYALQDDEPEYNGNSWVGYY